MSLITEEYQRTLPFALYSVSPQLAALHATRARLLNGNLIAPLSPSCIRCGSIILPGQGSIRLSRRRTTDRISGASDPRPVQTPSSSGSYQKILLRKCAACGHQECRNIDGRNAQKFPSVRRASKSKSSESKNDATSGAPLVRALTATPPGGPVDQRSVSPAINTNHPPGDSRRLSPLASTGLTPNPSPHPSASAKFPKVRSNKKRSGLQEMLARNRDLKRNENEEGGSRTSLADFLVEL